MRDCGNGWPGSRDIYCRADGHWAFRDVRGRNINVAVTIDRVVVMTFGGRNPAMRDRGYRLVIGAHMGENKKPRSSDRAGLIKTNLKQLSLLAAEQQERQTAQSAQRDRGRLRHR